ncbi:hypothetical protein SEUCBS140593_004775 [Sporothrix eucalyptigena]|uniref:SGNH hydrolase-type esterase domain-containing protein n=1 Tax=Sporothrix eucalyptigena TaxID=1812306 RepID=A0ABP0BR52_9PEZI
MALFSYTNSQVHDKQPTQTGLGDSYASGIGADCCKITEDEPKNKYACVGAKTGGVTDPPAPGQVSQVRQMRDYGNFVEYGFTTLSIGGNNVGFGRIVASCLLWHSEDNCEKEWAKTTASIASLDPVRNLTKANRDIMDTATVPNFRLFVTGYEALSFGVLWWSGPPLTREPRTRANAMTLALNQVIYGTVLHVNSLYDHAGSQKWATYIDTDMLYENARWCDGSKRKSWRNDAYFFNVFSSDQLSDGSLYAGGASIFPGHPDTSHQSLVIDIGGLNFDTCLDDANDAENDNMMMRYVAAQMYAAAGKSGPSTRDALGTIYTTDDDSGGSTLKVVDDGGVTINAFWDKAFHPKTYSLGRVAGKVYHTWDATSSP